MEELTVISQGGDVDETSQLRFDAAYNDPSANAIFNSGDGISFRVEEFYLKAVSPIFKDMFALPTKGGLVQLPETSDVIRVVLNQITGAEGEEVEAFDTMVSAFELAKRFDMKGPMASIKEELHEYWDGPKLLALACQQVPIDKPLVRTALSRFVDHMDMDSDIFRSHLDNRRKTAASPDPKNLTTNSLESLTVPVAS
ncbi:hypothetical protein QFC21_001503 [Naganishia friedmannii]|uniref:Uncharacterized protein n=1 Tax=Naganishia friedmannii TaxID=89922 RepID=A0ACC2W412_9TREE|nr:hypothetical protein QFC21_001503 [Naganishia friedmannii]